MLTSAVQHARDGLGKRKDKKSNSIASATNSLFNGADQELLGKYDAISKNSTVSTTSANVQQQGIGMPQSNASSTCSSVGSGNFNKFLIKNYNLNNFIGDPASNNGANLNLISTYQQPQTTLSAHSGTVAGLANALYNNYNNQANNTLAYRITTPPEQNAILHLGQTLTNIPQETVPYNFTSMVSFI